MLYNFWLGQSWGKLNDEREWKFSGKNQPRNLGEVWLWKKILPQLWVQFWVQSEKVRLKTASGQVTIIVDIRWEIEGM